MNVYICQDYLLTNIAEHLSSTRFSQTSETFVLECTNSSPGITAILLLKLEPNLQIITCQALIKCNI